MEFCSVGSSTNGYPSLYDQVQSWSIADIVDENLFKDKVKQIPLTFRSVSDYFDAFVFPLLEEVRAELCFSMEMISRAPFAALVSCHLSGHYTGTRLFDIKVDYWRSGVSGDSHGLSRISSGDVVILLKSKPQSAYELQSAGQRCVLGHVVNIVEDDTGGCTTSTSFRVRLSRERDLTNYANSFYIVCFLVNLTKYERMWNKLHVRGNLTILNKVLQRYPVSEDGECYCLKTKDDGMDAKLDARLSSSLNPCQKEAVVASLRDMQCDHKASIECVCGPPGTGKTKTISTLLSILLERNCRTLMCAATNVAITVVLSHVLSLLKESRERGLDVGFSLANIVLVENEKTFGTAFDCENISLDFRVKQLAECLDPQSGWRACFGSLLDFLEKCRSQYRDLVKNGACNIGHEITVQSPFYGPFLCFVRDEFKATAPRVRKCISIFCTHLPQSFLLKQNIDHMQLLMTQIDSFGSLLLQDNFNFKQLRKLSSQAKGIQSLLTMLQDSIGELPLPDFAKEDSIEEFCLRLATLVMCEAHCSFRLYAAEMQPLNVLVIDEGLQLTECESVVALQLPGLKHAILFGDEYQLPATVKSNLSSSVGYGRSMFQRLCLLNWPKHVLNIQYRMHPAISSFPNLEFYLNQIIDAPNVRIRGCEKQYLPGKLFGPYSFINISQSREEIDDEGQISNLVEVAVLMQILQNLYREWHCSGQKLSVSVMSPYPAQVMEIERRLVQRYQNCSNFAVKVKTIEEFQGSEADVVIISTVRSNVARSMQSISDFRRVNVALTRARHCLWVLGNEKALAKADPVWKALISNAKERKCLFNADEDLNIGQVIINVKTELDQLVDLLNKDSFIFKCTRWKVIFSERFVKSFSKLPSTWSKKVALNFLVRLANGWRPKKYKSEPSCQSSLKIARQFKIVGYYIICTNDIVKETGYATQVFKVWDILHLEDVPELVRKLDCIYGAYTDEFLIRCKEKCLEGSLEVPRCYRSFNISRYKCGNEKLADIVDADNAGASYAENSKVKDSLLLMKFYSLSAGLVNHLLSSSDGRALDLPFEVTDEEREVILHENTTFVLARSGTGKTTVLAMKLFQKQQLHHMASEGLCPVNDASTSSSICKEACASGNLHQLFVTVNPRLCFSVKQHVSSLRRFVSGEFAEGWTHADLNYIDENEEFKDIPNSFHDIPANSFPLIMTFRIFLLMLDATVGASFFDRYQEIRDAYSMDTPGPRILSLKNLVTRKEVTYDKFRMSYWPHFDSTLTRGLDSSRAFTEINSCIKGGHIDDHKLPRESYIQLSHKRVSNFCEKEREMIYNIFECYEKMKMVRGEFDLADLVNDLHWRLKHESYDGQSMDFVYIDEVQDLTMKQIALFKYVCNNVEDGFVFAGDTAQTIARGVDFRFQDIRGLFYREFLHIPETNGKHRVQDKGKISPLFHLSQNFRTHLGVLNLAQSIVDLIYHFFPSSIDILNRESSLLNGEAPILLDCGSKGDAVIKIFENQGYSGENAINFGSEQVILVRDDCARNEISDHIRGHALVLTIFECKGLEFQDVLLYNFFGSSSLNNEWRVIYEYMEKNMVGFSTPVSSPSFNPARHNVLCFELKQLYVAITRTRQRLWICERDGLLSPMFDYWRKLNVVQVRELESSFVKAMQVSSSLEDWRARGLKMLQVQNYKAAEMCFERAGDCHLKYFARAAGLKVSAENMRSSRLEKSVNLFREAADLYERINNTKEAARCYFGAEDYEKAGNLFYRESDLYKAAQCFNFGGCYERAAQVYAEGGYFYACLNTCSEGELFDLGLRYVRSWKQKANFGMFAWKGKDLCTTEQEFLKKCATASHKQRNMEAMMKYVKDFTSPQLMRMFLKKLGCFAELLELEVEFGNILEAAIIARQIGNILREGDLLGQAGQWQDASILYFAFAFASRLWADGNNGWPTKEFPSEEENLWKAKAAAHKCSRLFYEIMCTNIQLLTNANCEFSELKGQLAFSQRHNNLRGEILCARRILDSLLKAADASMLVWVKDEMPIKKLAYYWNLWKDHVLSIFKYLDSQKGQTIGQYQHYGEFCFEYLGVRKQSDDPNSSCSLLYADAQWVKYVPGRTSKTDSISMYQLLAAARWHWCKELIQTGMNLLKTLKCLYDLAIHSSMPARGILIQLFEAVALLRTESSFLIRRSDILPSLQSYIELLEEAYLPHVFCLRWNLLSKETILQSESSRSLLKKVILKKIMLSVVDEGVSAERISSYVRQVVILLGSSSTFNEPCKEIISKSKNDSPWQLLLKDLVKGPESEAHNAIESRKPEESRPNVSPVQSRRGALADLCKSWGEEHDCVSPCCFIYLLDRLLVLVSCFKGHLFATRSSVIEWLMHLDWKVDSRIFSIKAGESSSIVGPTYDLLAQTVHQLLLMSHQDTKEWIKNSRLDVENGFQALILRLTVSMCMICLNSGKYLDLLSDAMNRSEIISELPTPFVQILVKREGCSLLNVLAEALHKINDPLVIMRGKFMPNLYARHAIFLNVFGRSTQYKGSIIGKFVSKLFP